MTVYNHVDPLSCVLGYFCFASWCCRTAGLLIAQAFKDQCQSIPEATLEALCLSVACAKAHQIRPCILRQCSTCPALLPFNLLSNCLSYCIIINSGSRRIIIGSLVNILQFAHSLTFFLFKVSEISPFRDSKISDFYYQSPPQFCCWRSSSGRAILHSLILRQYW